MNATATKTVTIFGDVLEVRYNGNMWVSPHNGQQHSRAEYAMRSEIEAYYSSCGDDPKDEKRTAEIDGYVSQMV